MHTSFEIKKEILMTLKKYNLLWTNIKQQSGTLKISQFWKALEETVNGQLKILFLSDDESFPYLFGFDDDKLHFNYSSVTEMSGISKQHHVKDNRRGLTLHTCAYSATCVPVAVSFQRAGESVQDTYLHTMTDIFGTSHNGQPNLRGVTLASDRGYWEKSLLFGPILESGADVVGTTKRVSFFVRSLSTIKKNFLPFLLLLLPVGLVPFHLRPPQ